MSLRIVGIAGSLRKGSYNQALLRAAAAVAPSGTQVELGRIAGIPLYDGDAEAETGTPPQVSELRKQIAAADGLLLVTPEYNGSVPGVLKNALDWVSRPAKDNLRVFDGKPVALMGATPGLGGTRLAQTAWLPVLRNVGAQPWFGKQLYVSNAAQVFDTEGHLIDAKVTQLLTDYMSAFASFLSTVSNRHS